MAEVPRKETGKDRLIIFASLVVLVVASNAFVYIALQNQITALTTEKNNLQTRVNTLTIEKTNLQSQLNSLNTSYQNYKSTHSHTNSEYDQLNTNYLDIASYYRSLSNNVTELYDLLYSYSRIPDAFVRTLNDAEVRKTSSAVSSAGVSLTNSWSSYQKIYNYVTSNIKYVQDIDMPYTSTYWHVNLDGFDYITKFTITEHRNYVQTPSLTLEIKQGDCDDQAVLAYAMIKYYMKYVFGTEYRLYVAEIDFSDDSAHLAVILPVQGGQICVIDPAGSYLTSSWGIITSELAQSELQTYSNYWSPAYITYMKLYRVSVKDGSYSVAAEGTLNQVAAFLVQD